MTEREFLKAIEELLAVEPETLTPESRLEEYVGWDSVGHLNIVSLLDESFEMTVSVKRIRECQTVRDLMGLTDGRVLPGGVS